MSKYPHMTCKFVYKVLSSSLWLGDGYYENRLPRPNICTVVSKGSSYIGPQYCGISTIYSVVYSIHYI